MRPRLAGADADECVRGRRAGRPPAHAEHRLGLFSWPVIEPEIRDFHSFPPEERFASQSGRFEPSNALIGSLLVDN